MSTPVVILIAVASAVVFGLIGAFAGFTYRKRVSEKLIKSAEVEASRIREEAKKEGETKKKEFLLEAKEESLRIKNEADRELKERRADLQRQEKRVLQKEESLDRKSEQYDKKDEILNQKIKQADELKAKIEEVKAQQLEVLQNLAGMTSEEAKTTLISRVEEEARHEMAMKLSEIESEYKETAEEKARDIITTAIQRCAADHTAEVTVTSVHIPSDDLKGRIIGREGRNIRTFEQVSGVNLVIDDTPETVVLSSFDPVRRETARVALENLIADGRIHPARIEEMYHKAADLVQQRVREAGEQAAFDTGIHDLHPEIVKTLGALRYRTSFGQNVLQHSLEVSDLCGVMASELGLDVVTAKRAGLLHDLGKAIDHDVEGPHAVIGAELARRYGEKPVIVHAIEAHHADVDPNTVLDVLVQAADAVSASRPGARRESAENYIKRLEKLEEIANSHDGVERTYAMQAGREVHVMVQPDKISDAQSTVLAHDIAHQIEEEMEYPGQVRVVVIRESRAVDIAK